MNKYKGAEDFEYQKILNNNYNKCINYVVALFVGAFLCGVGATLLKHKHINPASIEQKMSVEYTNSMSISNYFISLEKP